MQSMHECCEMFNIRSRIFFLRILPEVVCKLNCVAAARNSCWFTMATLSDGIESQMMLRIIRSIAEKCFDIRDILKMVTVKSVELGNNSFSINHIIRCRSELLPLGFSIFVLVLIL